MSGDPFDLQALLDVLDPERAESLIKEVARLRELIGDYAARLRRIDEWCGDPEYDMHARGRVQQLVRGGIGA